MIDVVWFLLVFIFFFFFNVFKLINSKSFNFKKKNKCYEKNKKMFVTLCSKFTDVFYNKHAITLICL